MKMVTVREFRANPGRSLKTGKKTEDVVLTNNGKPVALLWPVNEENLEESLKMARRIRAERAIHQIQMNSVRLGLDKMTMDEIDAEIALARKEAAKRNKP
ncbi:MAG TPA: type II toxin-antitoxin system prevent-host-death family antitoxin [bacterium]|jgi:prevent-host-death family protein|nr:type II toxin-antitoxin system prevent-host-death family antitoxin [bacterium]